MGLGEKGRQGMGKAIYYICIVFSILCLCSCKSVASKYIKDEQGIMVEVERLELRGTGKVSAKFSDKSEIQQDSGFKIPNEIPILLDRNR